MTSRYLLAAASALALAVPGLAPFTTATAVAKTKSAKGPEIGAWGFDETGMDKTVRPGDDFFKFVNGGWAARTEIPSDKSNWGGFMVLRDLSDQRTRAIIEEMAKTQHAEGSVEQKVGDFFASFMDEEAIEAKGVAPVKPMLDRIAAIDSYSALASIMGEMNRNGVDMPIGASVLQDLKNNTQYAAYAGQGGLGLPDRDYYLVDNPKFVETRAKYKAYIAKLFTLAGVTDGAAKAERIYALEARIAAKHWSQAESRQIDKLYNPVDRAKLASEYPGFEWTPFLKTAGLDGQPRLIVAQNTAVAGIAKEIGTEPLDVWRDYLSFQVLDAAAPLLTRAFAQAHFEFNEKELSGTPAMKERWKRGVDAVNGALGEAVGQIYVARHFPPEAKKQADALVKNLIRAMDKRLSNLAWMDAATRDKARAKLAAFTPKIGYPDKWRDYSALKVVRGDALGNGLRAAQFEYDRQLAKIGKPVDRSEWFMTPQTVNAYANPLMNEIVFPAAILQPPFFDPKADPAVNYGGIGMVIGHEISHHFDDQGRKFDKDGNLTDWWTEADVKRFADLTAKMVKQYGEYEPLPGKKVNGELTLGENIADLAGLVMAYDAYHMSLGGKKGKKIGGYTPEQRFFLGFGQVWRNKYRDANLLQRLTTDPHTPGHFRPYVVRNLDAWYDAFAISPDSKGYLKAEDRIHIW